MNIIRFAFLVATMPVLLLAGCGGGGTSSGGGTATPTPTATATPEPTATPTASATPQPTGSPTPSPTAGAAALGGINAHAVPEIYGIYIAPSSQVIIDQSANFIGALFPQGTSDPIYVSGKLTGSNYDAVSRVVFFQASGEAYDSATSTKLTFAISDGRMDDADDLLRALVVSLSDGRSVSIGALRKEAFSGTNSGDLIGEFTLVHTPQQGQLAFRIDGPSGTITTPAALSTDCNFVGTLVPNGPSWTVEVSASGEVCPYSGSYLGIAAASLLGSPFCENPLFRQIALFDAERAQYIVGCLKRD